MNKYIKRGTLVLLSLVMVVIVCSSLLQVSAAAFSISAKNNGNGTTTVSVSGNVVGGFTISAGGASATATIREIGGSGSAVLNTGAGTFTVTVKAISISNANYEIITDPNETTATTTVTVTMPGSGGSNSGGTSNKPPVETPKEDTRSKDNSLSSLTVSQGTLTPEFNSATTEYTINLDSKIKSFGIDGKATDTKATVSGTGEKTVEPGENNFEVVVTAENGSTKTYVIKAIVDETPTIFLTQGKNKLGVVTNTKDLAIPDGLEETKITINGEEVKAWTNGNMKKTILYMINEKGEKNFYLYDKEVTSIFKPIALLGQNVYIVDIASNKQKVEGLKYQEVTIDGNKMMGWSFENKDFANYSIISVMNEKGEMVNYQYESTQNTLQLYSNSAPITQKQYDDAKNYETYTLIASIVAGIFAVVTIALAVLCVKFKQANTKIVGLVTKNTEVK